MNFNNHNLKGSGLLEVVIALAMTGTILASGLALQFNVFRRVARNSFHFTRLSSISFLLSNDRVLRLSGKELNTHEKTFDDPPVKVSFQRKPVVPASVLGRFRQLLKEESTGVWIDALGVEEKESLVGFLFMPKPKQKKEGA